MRTSGFHINCDMGESFGRYTLVDDARLMPYIDACNIACGFHAGDPSVMSRTIALAIDHKLEIGAHPSYPDRQGFGRRTMDMDLHELEDLIQYQVAALNGMVQSKGGSLTHVKAHGALYNKAAKDAATAQAIAKAVYSISKELILFAPPNSVQAEVGEAIGLCIFQEAFIDRAYNNDGSLVSRNLENAVITNPQKAFDQASEIAKTKSVRTIQGSEISMQADTLCIHGDNPAALEILAFINDNQ